MTSIAYHIEKDYSVIKKQVKFFAFISIGAAIGAMLAKAFRNPYRKAIIKISHSFDTILSTSLESLGIIQKFSTEQAKAELDKFNVTLKEFRELKLYLEKQKYLHSTALKEKTLNTLSSLYNVQIALKKKAYANSAKTPTDSNLLNALALNSQQVLSKQFTSN